MAKANRKHQHSASASRATARVKEESQDRTAKTKKLGAKVYRKELAKLQAELLKVQEYIRMKGLKVAVIFEGRDAAGKGSAIKRISQTLNPRTCRIVALGTATER